MNKKEKADALVEQIYQSCNSIIKEEAIILAIVSTKNTIKVLEDVKDGISDDWYKANVAVAINEQTELLTELKSRL